MDFKDDRMIKTIVDNSTESLVVEFDGDFINLIQKFKKRSSEVMITLYKHEALTFAEIILSEVD